MSNRFPAYLFGFVFLAGLVACSQSDEGEQVATSSEPAQEQAAETASAASDCELVMGWDPWPPYQYENASGEVTGLDIEVAREVASKAGCTLSLTQASWVDLLRAINKGEIDIVAGATRTPEREDEAWFTSPYRTESFVLYMRADERHVCEDVESLRTLAEGGMQIGTVADYYYGDVVSELQADPEFSGQVIDATVSETNLDRLLAREIDAFIEDPFVATAAIRERGIEERIAECPLRLHSGDVSFMFSKQGVSEENFRQFEDALADMKASGKLQELVAGYREVDGD